MMDIRVYNMTYIGNSASATAKCKKNASNNLKNIENTRHLLRSKQAGYILCYEAQQVSLLKQKLAETIQSTAGEAREPSSWNVSCSSDTIWSQG